MNEDAAIVFQHEDTLRPGEVGREAAGIVDRAVSNNDSHPP